VEDNLRKPEEDLLDKTRVSLTMKEKKIGLKNLNFISSKDIKKMNRQAQVEEKENKGPGHRILRIFTFHWARGASCLSAILAIQEAEIRRMKV
jgi:uncharacterized protein (UPF0248 family)